MKFTQNSYAIYIFHLNSRLYVRANRPHARAWIAGNRKTLLTDCSEKVFRPWPNSSVSIRGIRNSAGRNQPANASKMQLHTFWELLSHRSRLGQTGSRSAFIDSAYAHTC